jgi:hypothetical protein
MRMIPVSKRPVFSLKLPRTSFLFRLFTCAVIVMLPAFLAGCAVEGQSYYGYTNEGNGYPVEWRHDQHASTTTTIDYQSPEVLAQNEIDQANRENRPPNLAQVPKGGRLTVHLHGHNPHAGNPKNYDFAVTDKDGHVLKQETGPNKPSPVPTNRKAGAPVYEGTHTIDLQTPVTDQVKVNVVNRMDNSKEQYTINRPSSPPSRTPTPIPPTVRSTLTR